MGGTFESGRLDDQMTWMRDDLDDQMTLKVALKKDSVRGTGKVFV